MAAFNKFNSFACLIFLAGCGHKIAVPSEGAAIKGTPQQEIAQCAKEPSFPGCEHVGK